MKEIKNQVNKNEEILKEFHEMWEHLGKDWKEKQEVRHSPKEELYSLSNNKEHKKKEGKNKKVGFKDKKKKWTI